MRYTDKVPDKILERAASDRYFRPTNTALALMFCVSYDTIILWKRKYPPFADAIEKAYDAASDHVEDSLLKRVHGYEFVEEREEASDDGIKRVTTKKHMPADPSLLKYYLNNRRPEEWSDRQEVHQTGETTTTVVIQESDAQVL
ncbi:MAG TPA: hypothetical protein O0X27_04850 [Methanocorpusculum sp.]|nr:hypothetical protein [Methanocorpusculum sp.]